MVRHVNQHGDNNTYMTLFKKYLLTFLITSLLFFIAWQISSYITQKKVDTIERNKNEIALRIMGNEDQLSLSDEELCSEDVFDVLDEQIGELAEKIAFAEEQVTDKELIINLKKQYTILQVKDFLINKQKSVRCNTSLSTILFFYDTKEKCIDCMKQSYVLDAIRSIYPEVRVYAFDYTLDLSTIEALKVSYALEDSLPVLVINGKAFSGFQSLEVVQRFLLSSHSLR